VVNEWHTGCRDCIYQLVDTQTWECEKLTLSLNYFGEQAVGIQSDRKACRKLKLHSVVYK